VVVSDAAAPQRVLEETRRALEATFERAVAGTGIIEHRRQLAGHSLLLRFAGPALVDDVLDAFGHLPEGSGDGVDELTICIWDTSSTDTQLPASQLIPGLDELTQSPLFRSGDLSFLLQHGDSALNFLDAAAAIGFHCRPSAGASVHHRGAPLRLLLSWWLNGIGWQLVHSAAVGHEGRAVLLTGPSGSGKSTVSLACARDGLDYLGDDYVVLAPEPPVVHSVYRSAKLERSHRSRHEWLLPDPVASAPDEKALGYLADPTLSLPVYAVVLPRVTELAATEVRVATPGRALLALAPATVLQLPGQAADALRAMKQLVEAVPVFELRLGADLERVPSIIRSLVQQ
jgi:hypothetical protein